MNDMPLVLLIEIIVIAVLTLLLYVFTPLNIWISITAACYPIILFNIGWMTVNNMKIHAIRKQMEELQERQRVAYCASRATAYEGVLGPGESVRLVLSLPRPSAQDSSLFGTCPDEESGNG